MNEEEEEEEEEKDEKEEEKEKKETNGDGMKQESGEMLEVWWGEVGPGCSLEGDDVLNPPPPQPPPLPPPPQQQQQHHHHHQHQQPSIDDTWATFPPTEPELLPPPQPPQPHQPPPQATTAPLTHLETLTHSTFLPKSEGNVEVNQQDELTQDIPAVPPPTPWFPCPQCGKSFRTRITLSRHEKIHKGNAFPCPMCPKVFYQVSNVKYHVHAVHGRQYTAPVKGTHESV
ncbi:Zinc finger protein 3 [Portunus trituberculatus]|uniref:Zinc finger protein 3 n=1 Tax=Portunus trituberculatus TaxID=210409 RepID=A0A5B7EH05_PORTR|nr:Zinc finger protein 3 [Portunus trituberculatus]